MQNLIILNHVERKPITTHARTVDDDHFHIEQRFDTAQRFNEPKETVNNFDLSVEGSIGENFSMSR